MKKLIWKDDANFSVNGQRFLCDTSHPDERKNSNNREFTIVKNREFFRRYEEIIQSQSVDSILELGVYQGGSAAFLMSYFEPNAFVAIELSKKRIEPLDNFVKNNNYNAEVYYGVDQTNSQKLHEICEKNFPNGIDMIVDDASHDYEMTKKSMETLFPYLNSGGVYVVEDWSWSHTPASARGVHPRQDKPALTNLLFECCMIVGSDASVVESVQLSSNMFVVTKGSKKLEAGAEFMISDHYRSRPNWKVGVI